MNLICVKCGKATTDIKGSMKHPYCSTCFGIEFKNKDEYWNKYNL